MENNFELCTDVQLVNKFKSRRAGAKEAFAELISRHENKVYALALRYTKSEEDAEEVVQDVFVTLFKKAKSFEGKSAFTSWLYRITVNAALMKLRKRKQEKAILTEDLSLHAKTDYELKCSEDMQQSDSRSIQHETRAALEMAVNRLPDEYKAVFIMRDVDGLSNQEVSEILDISVAAVKSRLHRARLMLQKKLQRYYDDYTGKSAMTDLTKTPLKMVG